MMTPAMDAARGSLFVVLQSIDPRVAESRLAAARIQLGKVQALGDNETFAVLVNVTNGDMGDVSFPVDKDRTVLHFEKVVARAEGYARHAVALEARALAVIEALIAEIETEAAKP